MKSLVFGAAAAGALLLSLQALAVQDDNRPALVDEIFVISSRQPVPLRQLGTAVSRVGPEEISQRAYFGVADLLRTLPSIGVSNSGGLGKPTALRIRGEEGFRTLVLIDGMDVSDPTPPQAAPRFEHLPSAGFSSVEVLRGAQGMMYGADAGGVVSIRTGSPEPGFQSRARMDAGRYGTEQYLVDFGGKAEQGDFYVSANRLRTDGFNARSNDVLLGDDDGHESTTFHSRAAWNINDTLRLQAVARDVESDNEYDNCYSSDYSLSHDCRSEFNQRSYRLSLDYVGFGAEHKIAVQRSRLDSADFAGAELSFTSQGELQRWEYLAKVSLNPNLDVLLGVDHKREKMKSGGEDLSRNQIGYFVEAQSQPLDDLYITLGLRQDDNDDFGRHESYRFSAAYWLPAAGNRVKLKTSIGNGFRAPSLYEVAYNASSIAFPPAANVELKEEESSGFDIGVEFYPTEHSQLELIYFRQRIKDEIYFDPAAYSGYLQSQGRSESSGVELSARHQLSSVWTIAANMTFNDTETRTGEPRLQRPKQMANISLSAQPNDNLALHMNWRAARRILAHDGSELDNYHVLDASARYQASDLLSVYARLENALDRDYEEVKGYNTSGRAAYLGFEVRL